MITKKRQSFLLNCVIHKRAGDEYLFSQVGSAVECFLDGYEIRPLPQDERIHDNTVSGTSGVRIGPEMLTGVVEAARSLGRYEGEQEAAGNDRADAERYRFIRGEGPEQARVWELLINPQYTLDVMDAAIDAAMKERP